MPPEKKSRELVAAHDDDFSVLWLDDGVVRAGSLARGLQAVRLVGYEDSRGSASKRIDLALRAAEFIARRDPNVWGGLST